VDVGFLCGLYLWKSIGRASLETLSERFVEIRGRLGIVGSVWARNRDVGVELLVPHEDVQTLDLVDQKRDRPSCCCDLCAWVVLESAAPSAEDLQLVGVESLIGHFARLSLRRVCVCMSA
jgi:hypothetical protein